MRLLTFPAVIAAFALISIARAASCSGNTATTRSEWCDYSIDTDYYTDAPSTGVTVEYYFEIQNITLAPDGVSRQVQAVNGSIPGPTIEADWGDTIVVHVSNAVTANGTSLHFHGIRQNYTNQNDGVSSITQCPTAPGDSITYTFRATQYGSSWYHSHFALQAWDGVFGGIVIHGPASANYDTDLGSLFLIDWTHTPVDTLYHSVQLDGPISLDTGLINGTNEWDGAGAYFTTNFTAGDSYLLRLVNGAIDTHFDFSIDNHTLQVIAMDFVPITPYTTTVLSIGMGQRYDVVVTANASSVADAFWLRAVPDAFCSTNGNAANIKGVVYYNNSISTTPTTSAYSTTENDCADEPAASLVPVVSKTASAASSVATGAVAVSTVDNLFKWYLNSTTFNASWADPTALQLYDNDTSFTTSQNVLQAPTADAWYTLLISTSFDVPHPLHLHGHDFYILASGSGSYDADTIELQTANPPRRDTAMLPASGYLVLGFQADNPGVWLLHCHIGWHTEEGLALQVLERESEIMGTYDEGVLTGTCEAWSEWVQEEGKSQEDDDGI